MSRVVASGYAIANDHPIDSSEYQIKIIKNGSNSKDKKTLKIGDRAHYTGTQENKAKQYAGDLTVYEFSKSMGEVTCVKPDGKLTS